MQVTLKIERYNPESDESRQETFSVDVVEEATLLDVLDVIKDEVDGSLTYRKSCRMAVCGSCGMRMDGAAVLACKTPMRPLVEAGEVPVISPMGNLPVLKDLVVDMEPFWAKFRAIKPYLDDGGEEPPVKEWRVQQEELDRVMTEALCIQCGCCVSECNSMEADPDFLGPAALAKAARFVNDVRDRGGKSRLEIYNGPHGVWDCTRCYFCNQRCPKGVHPRDAIAKVGAAIYQEGMHSDGGARHAKVFVKSTHQTGYLLETHLVPETVGPVNAIKEIPFALRLARAGKVPNPLKPHKAKKLDEARPEYYLHLNARILGQAEQLGQDTLMTICNVCTLNLRQANAKLQADPELLQRVNRNLKEVGAASYSGGVDVRHLLWEIAEGDGYEKLKQIAEKPLTGIKIAPFYGCQILRPSRLLGFEDPDRPQSLERIIEACGAQPVDYPSKIKCCGFPIVLARAEVALGELIQPLAEAKEAGADAMVTPCPLCHLSLDAWQSKASREADMEFDLPIFHLAQLVGAAAGLSYDELQFKRHVVKAYPVTDKIYQGV